MKGTARSYAYRPGMDEGIMDTVRNCSKRQEAARFHQNGPTCHGLPVNSHDPGYALILPGLLKASIS